MGLSLEEAIARVPQWNKAQDIKTSPLGGGITNRNFRIDVGNESFVLRIAGDNTELLGIRRQNEYEVNSIAGELGIAPEVVYFIQPEGYLVTRFIEGRPFTAEEIRKPENMRQVVDILKKIHGLPFIPGVFSAFQVVEDYTEVAHRYQVEFPENFDWLISRMQEAKTALSTNLYTPHPCHNDLLNENFLFDGRIRILDWEYAGMGDIFFDLANLSANHKFSDDEDRLLIDYYFGQVTRPLWAYLKIMKVMSDFREAMWGLVQIGISKLDFDFRDYGNLHFNRMTKSLSNPLWGEWLTEVALYA
jgi:thiamine kinase-like enzyme